MEEENRKNTNILCYATTARDIIRDKTNNYRVFKFYSLILSCIFENQDFLVWKKGDRVIKK